MINVFLNGVNDVLFILNPWITFISPGFIPMRTDIVALYFVRWRNTTIWIRFMRYSLFFCTEKHLYFMVFEGDRGK